MCGSVIDWILAYIMVKMHNFECRVGKNYIFFFKDHDRFGLGHKVQILYTKRGIEWCLFVALRSDSGFKHQGKSPLDTQDELCWYCYLKIYTLRKRSATVSLAFFVVVFFCVFFLYYLFFCFVFFLFFFFCLNRISIWIYLFLFFGKCQ